MDGFATLLDRPTAQVRDREPPDKNFQLLHSPIKLSTGSHSPIKLSTQKSDIDHLLGDRIMNHFIAKNQSATHFDEKRVLGYLPDALARDLALEMYR
jgi:hypothetical protein